jgi:putative FmdB family regulatory protein
LNPSLRPWLHPVVMPIYEYACQDCGRSFEELIIRRSDEADVACPSCKSRQVGRQMSRPAAYGGGSGGGGHSHGGSCGPVG